MVKRFEVHLVNLNTALGSEIRKTRSCLVISPDEMNEHIRTVIIAPMSTHAKPYPTRVPCSFAGKEGLVVLVRYERSTSRGWRRGSERCRTTHRSTCCAPCRRCSLPEAGSTWHVLQPPAEGLPMTFLTGVRHVNDAAARYAE